MVDENRISKLGSPHPSPRTKSWCVSKPEFISCCVVPVPSGTSLQSWTWHNPPTQSCECTSGSSFAALCRTRSCDVAVVVAICMHGSATPVDVQGRDDIPLPRPCCRDRGRASKVRALLQGCRPVSLLRPLPMLIRGTVRYPGQRRCR